ncbi:MAG: zinc ribbon domain-containing protein [Armatimonadetes bacterium]|nr:zinc ribbon domain-containing protein [Armatimonadota bacterium]
MPLYEFKCRDCEEVFEVRQEWKAPTPDCPSCGSGDVKKVYHAAALIFKGSGWHVNDYGKSGAKPAGSSNGSSASSESKPAASTSSESKPSDSKSSDSSSKPASTGSTKAAE